MSEGNGRSGDAVGRQEAETRVYMLADEIIEASGNYGMRVEKLDKAGTLLATETVRKQANRRNLTVEQAALEVIQEKVDQWPDHRGRAILRAALGFDYGTERGRPNRLGLLAAELNKDQPSRGQLDGKYLDQSFTTRLAPDLAAALLADERPPNRKRMLLIVSAAVLLLGAAALAFIFLRSEDELIFELVPQRCSIDVCNREEQAIRARTAGFTPGGVVDVEIFAPSGENANDLGGGYAYNAELVVDGDGSFRWQYWWEPDMATGTYHVEVTDRVTGKAIATDFELFQ